MATYLHDRLHLSIIQTQISFLKIVDDSDVVCVKQHILCVSDNFPSHCLSSEACNEKVKSKKPARSCSSVLVQSSVFFLPEKTKLNP